MSKQIYIDSEGNEIQVSGTVNTADMMPMSGNDSTKVSEAIGDLSTLTTTDKSSLVGAVKEVNKQILYTDVSIGNVSIGANGYADISNNANIPAIPTGYKVLFAIMTNFGSSSSKHGGVTIFTPHQGEYWVGSVANDSITGLEIRIIYIKN